MPPRVPRQYSRAFTPTGARRYQLNIDRVPEPLYRALTAKAKAEGVSIRALVLTWLRDWILPDHD